MAGDHQSDVARGCLIGVILGALIWLAVLVVGIIAYAHLGVHQ